jgi:hypothetical protein
MSGKFEVKFVSKGRSSAVFAKSLQDLLNKYERTGWSIIKTIRYPDGMLVMAHKEAPRKMLINPFEQLLRQVSSGEIHMMPPPPTERVRFIPESVGFLDTFFAANPQPHSKDSVIKKIPETLPAVLRRYPNEKLRPILSNLKDFCAAHLKDHAPGNCELVEILQAVVEAGEKHVQQSEC